MLDAAGDRPHAILFDAGMTLIHPNGTILLEELARHGVAAEVTAAEATSALVMAAEARHLPLPARRGGTERVALAWATLLGLDSAWVLPACVAALNRPDLYRELDPGAVATLRALRAAGIALGVVSNSAGTVRADLATFDLLEYFDTVVDSTVVGFEKPDPRIFRHALADLAMPASACWFVGDGLVNDVLAAQAVGFAAGILFDRFDCFGHLPGIARITSLADLVPAVAPRTDVPGLR